MSLQEMWHMPSGFRSTTNKNWYFGPVSNSYSEATPYQAIATSSVNMPNWYNIVHDLPNDGGTGGGVETPFFLPNAKIDKHMTAQEAKCYWMNYPDAAQSFINQGIELTISTANWSYNYMANTEHRIRSTVCQQSQMQFGDPSKEQYVYYGIDSNK